MSTGKCPETKATTRRACGTIHTFNPYSSSEDALQDRSRYFIWIDRRRPDKGRAEKHDLQITVCLWGRLITQMPTHAKQQNPPLQCCEPSSAPSSTQIPNKLPGELCSATPNTLEAEESTFQFHFNRPLSLELHPRHQSDPGNANAGFPGRLCCRFAHIEHVSAAEPGHRPAAHIIWVFLTQSSNKRHCSPMVCSYHYV